MKPFTLVFTTLIILCTAIPASATPDEPLPQFSFALDIVGTAYFEDIEHLKNGMMRAEGAEDVRVTRSSHNFTRIMGTFQGKREHFERDLAGLAQDRFSMRITEGEGGTVVVTITKLEPLVP
jgi:hypothetical protein